MKLKQKAYNSALTIILCVLSVSINYNYNDSHEKVTIMKKTEESESIFKQAKLLLLQVYRYILENNSLSFYSK